jgi:predicted RNase H-like HicB family nuclease
MKHRIKSIKLVVLSFKDDNIFHIYCPSLNLVGCGYTKKEADDSFKIVLEEYIRYTTENQTLIADLEGLGWDINGKKPTPPKILDSVKTDEELSNIFNNYDFIKHSIPVEMPFV